jgi:hypothetical protein
MGDAPSTTGDCENEFSVQLSALPGAMLENVRRATGDYIVPLVAEYTAIGSGTLIQIDQWSGILTAEHVVRASKPDLRLDWVGTPARYLRTSLGPFAHDLSIPTHALRIVTTERLSDAYGPDLAFVVLPPGPFLDQIKAKKSFYNLSLKTEQRKSAALDDGGFFALCGFPAVRNFDAPPELGFSIVNGLYGYAMFSGPDIHEMREGWDYYEIGVSQESADDFERNFGGVSGGSVWRIVAGRRAGDEPGQEYVHDMTFVGVAFYQMDDRNETRFFVRCHGPISVYDKFIDLIRATLS